MYNESDSIYLMNYNLGDKFCKNSFKNGRVHIFVRESIQFINVSLITFCKEEDLEIHLSAYTICTVAIYRSPSRNFQYFLNNFENILNSIYSNSIEIIIRTDININYLNDSTYKQLLHSLLAFYCLYSIVQFPTRIHTSSSAIGNIFINNIKFDNFSTYPFVNGMSDHDVQITVIHNLSVQNFNNYFYFGQKIDKCSITDFNPKLSYDSWDDIFMDKHYL